MIKLELQKVFADKKELQKTDSILAQLSEKGSTGISKELKELRDELNIQRELIANLNHTTEDIVDSDNEYVYFHRAYNIELNQKKTKRK